jgi:hypothetical protein
MPQYPKKQQQASKQTASKQASKAVSNDTFENK